jgi:acyl carrier protein
MARYLPDVCLEFLGRMDRQVKIRGFRIELGEIESVLAGHPAVREAVVLTREDTPGEKRLVAYVVPGPAPKLLVAELLSFLKQKLPNYMVPSVFFALEKLPRDLSGKINRRALPKPGQARPDLNECYTAARTVLEEKLLGIWEQALRLDRVGVHDDFFELGGHSLLAIQIISRARDAFHIELPLRALFDAPTVAAMALTISQYVDEKNLPKAKNDD